jgi:hypothetical protein
MQQVFGTATPILKVNDLNQRRIRTSNMDDVPVLGCCDPWLVAVGVRVGVGARERLLGSNVLPWSDLIEAPLCIEPRADRETGARMPSTLTPQSTRCDRFLELPRKAGRGSQAVMPGYGRRLRIQARIAASAVVATA